MTETTTSAAGPPPPAPPPTPPPPPSSGPTRLVRDPDDAVVAGVCAAVGRGTDTDPVLWRVTVAVLTLFGGAGVVLYALGWLLVPRRGERQSTLERLLRRPDRGLSPAGVVLVVAAAVVLLAVLDDGPGLGVLLVLGALAYLVLRERRDPAAPTSGVSAYATVPAAGPYPEHGSQPDDAEAWSVPPPAPARSRLGAVTMSIAALLTGLLLTLRLSGVDGLTAPRIVAAALLVVGVGLVVGTWVGRARWLLAVGAVLALVLGASAAATSAGVPSGVGERTWTPVRSGSYSLGVGEAVLDLRALPSGRPVELDAEVGLGELTVLVPEDLAVRVVAGVGLGELSEIDVGGARTVYGDGDDTGLREVFVVGDRSDGITAELDLEVGVGHLEVRRVGA